MNCHEAWFTAFCADVRRLPFSPAARLLIAEEHGAPRALLGLCLRWTRDGQLERATIGALAVAPRCAQQGLGSRLIRFAEGIARIHGCRRVDVMPDLEGWGQGRCWSLLGYHDPGAGLCKSLASPVREFSA